MTWQLWECAKPPHAPPPQGCIQTYSGLLVEGLIFFSVRAGGGRILADTSIVGVAVYNIEKGGWGGLLPSVTSISGW